MCFRCLLLQVCDGGKYVAAFCHQPGAYREQDDCRLQPFGERPGGPKAVVGGTPKLNHVTSPDKRWPSTGCPTGHDAQTETPAMHELSMVATRSWMTMTGIRD